MILESSFQQLSSHIPYLDTCSVLLILGPKIPEFGQIVLPILTITNMVIKIAVTENMNADVRSLMIETLGVSVGFAALSRRPCSALSFAWYRRVRSNDTALATSTW
jgi:hypothetical protein